MTKKFLIISTFFILISCSDDFVELEDRIKIQAEKNDIEMSFFQVKKEALYIQQWSKDNAFIGEINEFIQTEAGNNANIIMGIGEDEKLGSSVSVTIIATGFGVDQQHQIVNTEAKKIIHTLEEDQTLEHDLMGGMETTEEFRMPQNLSLIHI